MDIQQELTEIIEIRLGSYSEGKSIILENNTKSEEKLNLEDFSINKRNCAFKSNYTKRIVISLQWLFKANPKCIQDIKKYITKYENGLLK